MNYTVNGTAYEVNVTNNSAIATVTPTYASGMTGENATLFFAGISDPSEIVVTDNNVNVTNSLVQGGGNTASVGTVAGASYGFSLDGQYYKSQNTGRASSAALCRLNMDITTPATLTVHFINYAEATYDYGVIGNLDTALGTTSATTSDSYKWIGSSQSDNDPDEQTVTFSVPAGTHFVDFKFRKDNYTDSNNDALWFRYELTGTGSTGYQYTIQNLSADHTIVVNDAGPITYHGITASTSYAGATVSPATQDVIEGRSGVVNIAVANLYEIVVKDNNTTVTNSLVQNATGFTYTVSNIQADHTITVQEASYYTISTANTYANASLSVNPSKVYVNSGVNPVVTLSVPNLYEVVVKDGNTDITSGFTGSNGTYTYTLTNVQANHTISVEEAPYYTVTSNSTYTGATATTNPTKVYAGRDSVVTVDVENLYEIVVKDNGTTVSLTDVGTSTTPSFIPNSYVQSASTATTGTTYPPSNALAGTGSTSNYAAFSADTGANAKVEAVFDFDCSTIPANAVIESVSCSIYCRVSNATYLPTSYAQLYHGDTARGSQSANINATASARQFNGGSWTRDELNDISLHFIGQRGTSSTTSGASLRMYGANLFVTYHVPTYQYTVSNVQTDHTVVVEEAPYYTVTVNNSYQDATVTADPPKGYHGIDVDIRIEVADIDEISVKDNGNNVIASVIPVSDGLYRYTINSINADHTITVSASTRYQVTATSTYADATISPASASVIEGHSQTFTIQGGEDVDIENDVTLTDNGIDVTNQMVPSPGTTVGSLSYNLGSFDDANSDYVGIYNNYEASHPVGVSASDGANTSTSATTRASFYPATGAGSELVVFYNFTVSGIPEGMVVTNVTCQVATAPAYNGAGYDEMTLHLCVGTTPKGTATPISTASTNANIHTVDGGSGWTLSDLTNVKIKMYGLRNDTNSNNDNTGIRDNLNICGASLIVSYGYPAGFSYTINNVQSAHTLVLSEVPATYYTVSATSSYAGATITPATQSIRQNHVAHVQISASSVYDIVVKDNGVNVNQSLVPTETGFTYTTQKITEAHTITVEESSSFTITTSSSYAGATITPATQTVRQGMSAITYIEVNNPIEISVTDNGTEVGDQLVLVSAGTTYEETANLSTFDTVNSQYVGIYNNYDYTNAEGQSSASTTTRSSFYPATGAGSELFVYYNFSGVTGIPAGSVITNVSAVVVIGTAYSGQGYSDVYAQLCIGTTPVGEQTHPTIGDSSSTATAAATQYTVNGGSGWTLSDLNNAKILVYGLRNDTNSNNEDTGVRDNINIYGGTIIVTYGDGNTFNGYTYTINNIQTGHTVVVSENPQYTLSGSSNVQGVTITPTATTVYGRQTVVFTIEGTLGDSVVLDNGVDVTTQLRTLNATSHTYTIANVTSTHNVVVSEPSVEADYIKVGGQFKKVLGFYKKVNGVWTLISKASFDEEVSNNLVVYGGVIESAVIGEVASSNGAINISINDDALDGGTYRMVYENANRQPISSLTDITEFTIS